METIEQLSDSPGHMLRRNDLRRKRSARGIALDDLGESDLLLRDVAGTPDVNKGAAYVFTRSGATWTQQAKLTASDEQDHQFFGTHVVVDGDTARIGSPGGSGKVAFDPGSAYVFTRTGITWSQQAKLLASDAGHDQGFGDSVSLSGETAAIGTPSAKVEGISFVGAAYIFVRSNGGWFEQAKLVADDHAKSSSFGYGVSLMTRRTRRQR